MRSLAFLSMIALACGGSDGPDPSDRYPGGDTTLLLLVSQSQAFTFPAPNLTDEERTRFFTGNSFFNQAWVAAPASTTARDGLGPTFVAPACSTCHFRDGRGAPPEPGEPMVDVLLRLSVDGVDPITGGVVPEPIYGDQLQPFAVDGVPAEGRPTVRWTEVPGSYGDGSTYSLRSPAYTIEDLAFGPMADDVRVSPRVAPQMIGLGLLEAIGVDRLEAIADPDDEDGDGIRGVVQRVWDPLAGESAVGRFGWKAEQPTVYHQTAGAFLGDLGVTSSLFPDEGCGPAQTACAEAPRGGDPEVDDELLAKVAFYARTLAVPARTGTDDAEVRAGWRRFRDFGCASCHVPDHVTATLDGFPALSEQHIWPYTDLLLHDMGPELSDGRPVFEAEGSHWRTPPLWGLRFVAAANGHDNLLHDGRARGFAEAILWHGGEAEPSREAFRLASEADRRALLAFLESL